MSRRVSFWGGLSLALLMLGGCLLADVGIDPALDEPTVNTPTLQGGAGVGGSSGPDVSGGGSAATPAAGSGGRGGSEEAPPSVTPPAAGGSANSGAAGSGSAANAGSGNLPPSVGGAGSGGTRVEGADESCPDTTNREEACFSYCSLYTEVCQGFQAGGLTPYDYQSALECVDYCTNEANGWGVGTISSGNTILCRCAHAYLARTQNRNPHCFHSARNPTAMCL